MSFSIIRPLSSILMLKLYLMLANALTEFLHWHFHRYMQNWDSSMRWSLVRKKWVNLYKRQEPSIYWICCRCTFERYCSAWRFSAISKFVSLFPLNWYWFTIWLFDCHFDCSPALRWAVDSGFCIYCDLHQNSFLLLMS